MALSLGDYLLGAAGLAAFAAALLFAAVRVRGRFLPAWRGSPARLVEAVLWLALVTWVAEALGALGALERGPLLVAGVAVGLLVGRIAGRGRGDVPPGPAAPAPGAAATAVAALAVAAVVAAWAIPVAQSFAGGIDGADSTWYHLPQAARFAQTGSVLDLHFTDPYFLNWFYPQNTELLHAIGIVALHRDLLSPLINAGFLALGFVAAWSIGRPWGLGPQTTVAAALVLSAPMTLDFQAGEARADVAGLALFLAAVALVVNARTAAADRQAAAPLPWSTGPGLVALAAAGLAAGLAAGATLSLLAPVAALTVGAIAIAAGGTRVRVALAWAAGLLLGGGFWYLRNLAHAGNPLPWIGSIGPLSLPHPERAIELRPQFSVSHYLFNGSVWSDWLVPGLRDGIGPLWPAILAIAALATGLALLAGGRSRRRAVATRPFEGRAARAFGGGTPPRPQATGATLAMLGAVVVAGFVAYLLTPLTAAGEEGAPVGFVWNLRYLGPALALGLVLSPLVPPLRRPPWRWLTLAALAGLLFAQVALLDVWDTGEHRGWALAAGVAALVAFAAAVWLGRRQSGPRPLPRAALAAAAVALLIALTAAGQALQRSYLDARFADAFAAFDLDRAISWANSTNDARIATAGRGGVFFQYGLYGADLSNHVQWVGVPGPHGAWLPAADCTQWRAAINAGAYDYVVTTFDGPNPGEDATSTQRDWIRTDPAAKQILSEGPVAVYRLKGPLDPSGCPGG